jgi:hypothetical protein
MKLEDSPESIRQLWRFLLKTSNIKRKGGTKGFHFLSIDKAFTFGLFFVSVGIGTSIRLVFVIWASIEFKDCNKKSFI